VNGALNSFVRAAAVEAPRKIRVNVLCPPWVTETLIARKMDLPNGIPAEQLARAFVETIEGKQTGQVIRPTASG
jgi:NAD(P)-dependent dehydrogenase (short-subunit alcohol dehydrogenase family)